MKSRTFWLAIIWLVFVPAGFITQVLVPEIEMPLGSLVTFAGTVSTVYIGGNKGKQIAVASGAPQGSEGSNNTDD